MPFAIQITNPALEVRGVGPYAANDVRSMMTKSHVCDFRQLGCPESIFQSVLEKRARKHATLPSTQRSRLSPDKREWVGLVFEVLGQADVIAADKKRASRSEEVRDLFDEARFGELKVLLERIESPARYFRSIEDLQRAQRRLQELLAAQ